MRGKVAKALRKVIRSINEDPKGIPTDYTHKEYHFIDERGRPYTNTTRTLHNKCQRSQYQVLKKGWKSYNDLYR